MNLPDKLSDLLELAISDVKATVIAQPEKYEWNPWEWCYFGAKTCMVCLAGAVMANTLGRITSVAPGSFDADTAQKLRALNYLRRGGVDCAKWVLDGMPDEGRFERFGLDRLIESAVDDDEGTPRPVEECLPEWEKLVVDLREAGL